MKTIFQPNHHALFAIFFITVMFIISCGTGTSENKSEDTAQDASASLTATNIVGGYEVAWMYITPEKLKSIVDENKKIYLQFHTKNKHTFFADSYGFNGTITDTNFLKQMSNFFTLPLSDTNEYIFGNLEWRKPGDFNVDPEVKAYILSPFVDRLNKNHINYVFYELPMTIKIDNTSYDLDKIDLSELSDPKIVKYIKSHVAAIAFTLSSTFNPVPPKKPS